jgi:hypothetical protein
MSPTWRTHLGRSRHRSRGRLAVITFDLDPDELRPARTSDAGTTSRQSAKTCLPRAMPSGRRLEALIRRLAEPGAA